MLRRDQALDTLRGAAILAMVFALLLPNRGLPGWMLPAIGPGINWADLVFPFLVFTMGAAIPAAAEKRIPQQSPQDTAEANEQLRLWLRMFGHVAWRSAVLIALAAAVRSLRFDSLSRNLDREVLSLALAFAVLGTVIRLKRAPELAFVVNLMAMAACAYFILVGGFWGFDPYLLAIGVNYLFAALIWLAVRRTPSGVLAFAVIFGVLLIVRGGSPWLSQLWQWEPLPEVFPFGLLKYQLVALAGVAIGQGFVEHRVVGTRFERLVVGILGLLGAAIVLIAIPASSFGQALFGVCVLGANAMWFSSPMPRARIAAAWGFGSLAIGILFTGDSAILANPASLSYLLVAGGIAAFAYGFVSSLFSFRKDDEGSPISEQTLESLDIRADELAPRPGFLALVGQNPFLAYVTVLFIVPAIVSLSKLAESSGWEGALWASGITLCVGVVTAACSRARIRFGV